MCPWRGQRPPRCTRRRDPAWEGLPHGLQTLSHEHMSTEKPAKGQARRWQICAESVIYKEHSERARKERCRAHWLRPLEKQATYGFKKPPPYPQGWQMAAAAESVWRDSPFQLHGDMLCSQSCPHFTQAHRASRPHNYPGIRRYHPAQTTRFGTTKELTQRFTANKRQVSI